MPICVFDIAVRWHGNYAISEACESGQAPKDTATFLEWLVDGLTTRVENQIGTIEQLTDVYESELENPATLPPHNLPVIRRSIIRMRHYLEPQRHRLTTLAALDLPPVPEPRALQLRETANGSTIAVEELDELCDRLTSIQDERDTNVVQRQACNSYVLSVTTALFVPLSFITGLFRVNLAGIIGADHPQAIAILCLSMPALPGLLRWI